MLLEFVMVAMLSVCQGDYQIDSSYAYFKEDKTYLVVMDNCTPTEKKKYVPPPPPPKEKEVCEDVTREEINKAITVYFNLNSAKVKPEDRKKLKAFASKKDFDSVEVHGYTCDIGSANYNMKLSEKRAENVSKILERFKVNVTKIEGHGEYDCTAELRKKRNLCRKADVMSRTTWTETECRKVLLDGSEKTEGKPNEKVTTLEDNKKPALPIKKGSGSVIKGNTANRAKIQEDEEMDEELNELLRKYPNLKKLMDQDRARESNKKLPAGGR